MPDMPLGGNTSRLSQDQGAVEGLQKSSHCCTLALLASVLSSQQAVGLVPNRQPELLASLPNGPMLKDAEEMPILGVPI